MEFKDNNVLRVFHSVFFEYSLNHEELNKFEIYKLLFENKMIDVCDFNIFHVNFIIKQLSPNSDKLTFEQFLKLVFFIYSQQMRMLQSKNEDNKEHTPNNQENSELLEKNLLLNGDMEYPFDANEVSSQSIKLIIENKKLIYSSNNIVKVLLDQVELKEKFFDLCCPFFDNDDLFKIILGEEIISFLSMYSNGLQSFFISNSKFDDYKNVQYMNIAELISIIWNHNIYSNFDCETITNIVCNFLYPLKLKISESLKEIFDEPKLKNNPDLVKEEFWKMYIHSEEINFTFSTFVLMMACFALNLPENHEKGLSDSIDFFCKFVLEIKENELQEEQVQLEESIHNPVDEDYFPESKIYEDAKIMQTNPNKNDTDFLHDSLSILDKDIPDVIDIFKNLQNVTPNHSNTLFYNNLKIDKVKFPLNTLKKEVEEEILRKQETKEKKMIENAKKSKRVNPRDQQPKPVFFEDPPNMDFEKAKYFGNKNIEDLKNRFLINSYKDVLLNSGVYPCLLKEILIIPKKMTKEV